MLGGEEANLHLLVPTYLKLLDDFQRDASNVLEDLVVGAPPSFDKWYPPPPLGWVKINTDATIFRELGVGLGWVARDHHRRILEMGVKRRKEAWDATVAEAIAARVALSHVSARRWGNVILELDALGLIERLQSGSRGEAYLDVLLEDIRSLVPSFRSLMSSHVKRAGNTVAHLVARMSPTNGDEQIWNSSFPFAVTYLVDLDYQ